MKPKMIVLTILFILCLAFLLQNTGVVTLRFLFWKVSLSRFFLIPILIIVGFIMGFITGKIGKKSRKIEVKAQESEEKVENSDY